VMREAISEAIKLFPSKSEFCRSIGMSPQFLPQILSGKRPLPPRFAIQIERATNCRVTRYELRPDIFGEAPEESSA